MKQKCVSLCFSILPSLPLCFPMILLSLFCPSADFRIPCIPPHCSSKSPSISISLIVAATVSSVLGVGVILLFTAALFILRLRYKRTHFSPNETAPAINCRECPIPEFMTPITTLSDVTSDGVRYENAANDFTLEVPEGAVPLTLDVAVALFGPFQLPEGLRPVSPVFWVCVRDQRSFFSRPVSVTLPHFLDLGSEEDVKSLGLTFLKASHSKNSEGMYEFSKTDGEVDFECSRRFGVLKTSHFCSLCIASRDRPECLRMTQFCLTSLLPRSTVSVGKKQYAFFFVTFYNLSTC